MVHKAEAENLCAGYDLVRKCAIGVTRRGISARMVVYKNEGGGSFDQDGSQDITWLNSNGVAFAPRNPSQLGGHQIAGEQDTP